MKQHHKKSLVGSVIVGGGLILLGVLLLLPALGYPGVDISWRWWPGILIAVGLAQFVEAPSIKKRGEAVWTIFIGSWLLISFLHLWGLDFGTSWPMLLVGVGIGMVWKTAMRNRPDFYGPSKSRRADGMIDAEVIDEK